MPIGYKIGMTPTFKDLNLREEILAALTRAGYSTPTPIQEQAIAPALEGHNILGLAQTGTGKTAAFTLPILQHLSTTPSQAGKNPRALILAPTRELAIQILETVRQFGTAVKLRSMLIVGGQSQDRQVNDLRRGVDIIIATPGRLEDLQEQELIDLSYINHFVLDEADRMLDIGFMPAIKRIAKCLPPTKHVLFFSATMPKEVAQLAKTILHDPVHVEVAPVATPVERIAQTVIHVPQGEKREVLIDLLAQPGFERVIVFSRTKHGADKIARLLEKARIKVSVMHGRKSQSARQAALGEFERGKARVLVATDIAARGIDVDDVTHVINYDLPNEPDTYVHRIGRTARAGKDGIAISLCDNSEERKWLRDIEKLTRQQIPVADRPASSGFVIPPPQVQEAGKPNRAATSEEAEEIARRQSGRRPSGAHSSGNRYEKPSRPHRNERAVREERNDVRDRAEAEAPRAPRSGQYQRWDRALDQSSDRPARSAHPERSDRSDRAPRAAQYDRSDRAPRSDRPQRSDRFERSDRPQRSDRSDRPARQDRDVRAPLADRPERARSSERTDRPGSFNLKSKARAPRMSAADFADAPDRSTDKPWDKKAGSTAGDRPFGQKRQSFQKRKRLAEGKGRPQPKPLHAGKGTRR